MAACIVGVTLIMSVYVDELKSAEPYRNNMNWPYRWFCHMFADTFEELFDLAESIGLSDRWFQHKERSWMAHFDLTKTKRRKAVRAGAVEITSREWIRRHLHDERK